MAKKVMNPMMKASAKAAKSAMPMAANPDMPMVAKPYAKGGAINQHKRLAMGEPVSGKKKGGKC